MNEITSESGSDEPHWKLAKHGVKLLLNNRQEEAVAIFRMYPDSIVMYAGYSISVFMDALMTFEDEKLAIANQVLKETEKRCISSSGWHRLSKHSKDVEKSYADHLESQIIKADCLLYLSTLTFLQQDISGYFKGAWILHKSWKHYTRTYNEILDLYKEIVGELPDEETMQEEINGELITADVIDSSVEVSDQGASGLQAAAPMGLPDKTPVVVADILNASPIRESIAEKKPVVRNGYIPKSKTTTFTDHYNAPASTASSTCDSIEDADASNATMKKSQSMQSALSKYTQLSFATINSNFQYLSSTLNPFNYLGVKPVKIDKATITRLMCGVSFGYGMIQLGMSLLPPSILRLTNFLGFQGNRTLGLKYLMFSRCGVDMRAPMATLALLWYHTIVRPFFALDGNNVQAGVEVAAKLMDKAMVDYSESSVFLFFKGRVDRLKCDIPSAINAFTLSIEKTSHREIKLLSQHEVGWCYLIELTYPDAMHTFLYLRNQSRWSRSFYSYLAVITAGANSSLGEVGSMEDIIAIFHGNLKGSQLDDFLRRRFKACPDTKEALTNSSAHYWKMFVFELLYLWNSLPCCNTMNINQIIHDCTEVVQNDNHTEPFVGLSHLILGSCYCILREFTKGIKEFRACIESRKYMSYHADCAYISAFALYEMGYLLIRDPDTKQEGKQCLQQVQSYKDYDFEQRLSVRIHSILKHL